MLCSHAKEAKGHDLVGSTDGHSEKDMREAMSTKSVKAAMLVVPLMMAMLLPGAFTAIAYLVPSEAGDFEAAMSLMPLDFSLEDGARAVYYYLMNYMMPVFFVIIPVMASSIAGGSSIVGERERRTLATLLFSPLSIHDLFVAKIAGALFTAISVTLVAFAGFLAVAIVGSTLIYGGFVLDAGIWLTIILLIAPSISLVGITLMVLASARAHSFQEAQQYAVILMLPTMLLMMLPQLTGSFLFNVPQLLIMGGALVVLALIMLRLASLRFTAEKLLG